MTTVTSGNSLNNNRSSNNTSPASFNLAEEPTPIITSPPLSASLPSSSSLTSSRDRCRRCQQLVYCTERIGPVKDALYHKLCFKCLKCDRQLDFKTYFTNSIDLNDKEIYCQSHVPRSGKGVFSTENIHIQNVMKAPKLNVMQKLDDRHTGIHLDSHSVSIVHAMKAQQMFQQGREKVSAIHKFPALPPDMIRAREEVRRAQKSLEEKQRQEEDQLFMKFRNAREIEEKKIEREVTDEWEKRLQMLTAKYEEDLQRKKDKIIEPELTLRFSKEKAELERNMTLKRDKKREMARKQLMEKEQETTHSLVSKFSKEMITLIQEKELAVLTENGVDDHRAITLLLQPPPPQPPRRRKRDLYEDPSVFEHVDQQAIAVAESEQTSYTELVDQLTYGLLTDLEKSRAIFRWITVKDLNAIDFQNNLAADTPMGLLRGIKYGTETYHTLFMRLCSFAALHCVDVKGHSKSVGYEPGMRIGEGKFTNTWNAVVIDGEWRFVQCNWGARHLVMSKDKKEADIAPPKPTREKIKYQYDEHYFLPDPDDFILEFFPYKNDWQLLESPITLQQFEQLPFVRSLFFHYHLSFVNQQHAIIQTDNRGACDIKLRMPDSLKQRLAFHFHLRFSNTGQTEDSNDFQGIKLERYVLHTIQDDLVSFNIHLPQEGDYFIEIFASLVEPDPNPFGQSFKLKCVCKYRIVCKELTQRMHALPTCASGEWGPAKAIRHFNIHPLTHFQAIFETNHLPVIVKFKCPKLLKFHAKLNSNQYPSTSSDTNALSNTSTSSNTLDKYVKYDYDEHDFIVSFIIQLPSEGQYGIDLYARDPEYQTEKRTMSHCCKYIINYSKSPMTATAPNNNNNNNKNPHTYSDYSFDRTKSNGQQKLISPRVSSVLIQPEQTRSPRSSSTSRDMKSSGNSPSIPMPKIGGNSSLLSQFGMTPISHSDPSITLHSTNSVELQFQICKMVDFSFDLIYHQTLSDLSSRTPLNNLNQRLNASDYVTIKPNGGFNVIFALNLPKPGVYTFTIYAATINPRNDVQLNTNGHTDLPAVYTYLLRYV
ncbi:unnamed protein product [Rotaria socialis]|uniref:LIM zinc-binding domain-containing protein n=1 Tax=Rotaria socialis TaxID=392032 RepID=A0A820WQI3_9BILA|nr:unnamed protein product [Rotaria socialis]CAF3332424.1 unnamed protein product [Rotaria socialis]CAF4518074.1 unnamed protein product [Rotaria socialis]